MFRNFDFGRFCGCCLLLAAMWLFALPVKAVNEVQKMQDRVRVILRDGILELVPMADNAIRVRFYKTSDGGQPEFILTEQRSTPSFSVSETKSGLVVRTKRMQASLNMETGVLSYADASGKAFLSEQAGSRVLKPGIIQGEPCFLAEQRFESPEDEYLFGLGQFQDGHYNLRHVTRRLTQVNSQIAIPFVYSSKGYGLLWHQYGLTDFNPADNLVSLEKQQASSPENNRMMEVTTTQGTQRVSQNQSLYKGTFTVPENGTYSLFLDLYEMGNRHFLVVDGKLLVDKNNQWLPPTTSALVELKAGTHEVQVLCKASNSPVVSWKRIEPVTTYRSPHARLLDYVVFYGPSADAVIASYRNLSGDAPLFPLWAYGFWQCRERYTSGTHLVETVKEFRRRNLPMDVIVQDWQYWGKYGWGVPKFDEANYPNPAGFIQELHDLNAHFSISVWENLDQKSEVAKPYLENNLFIPNSPWVDVFNPHGRETHWRALNDNLFSLGVDSWWMDATEPENDALAGKMTFMGPGEFYRLTYPLFVSQAVYEGQRKASADKRVCILTRSAFPGQQRYGVINWSGDIGGSWETYRDQIVAGFNFTLTGLPYWTTDIGGFFRPGRSQYTDSTFHELLIRWYQWGAFSPIFRMHGYQTETEPWKYGDKVESMMRDMLNLRYQLLPYIYSEAWQVTDKGSTMMRPMVMDFNGDADALNSRYQYLFGKALLVAPVTEPGVTRMSVYLPKAAGWYDFYTGNRFTGGQTVKANAPLDKIPLFVKAGSILPVGPVQQYTGEKQADTLDIRVYRGADASFVLYEDEGDSYAYEQGAYSLIAFAWNEQKQELSIGKQEGAFPGSLKRRVFRVVLIDGKNEAEGWVSYLGKAVRFSNKQAV